MQIQNEVLQNNYLIERGANLLKIVSNFKKNLGCVFDTETSVIGYNNTSDNVYYWDEFMNNQLAIAIDYNNNLKIYATSPYECIEVDLLDFDNQAELMQDLKSNYNLKEDDVEYFEKFTTKDFELFAKIEDYYLKIK